MNIKNLPELTFASADVEVMLQNSMTVIENILGRKLARADPLTLFVKSLLAVIAQQKILIDKIAKDNLLFYSAGDALDHLGLLVGVYRLQPSAATVTAKVILSDSMNKNVSIAKGTRICDGSEIYFAMDDDLIFLPGETEKIAKFTCLDTGEVGNGFAVSRLTKIVDPQPYLLAIENITVSDGGADIESDDSLRERIRIAPESFSSAGPSGAYEFFVKKASSLITDVSITSDFPGEVDIYFLQSNSDTPTQEVIDAVYEILDDRKIRPLTDKVVVKVPEVVAYDIELKYFISSEDSADQILIQSQVEKAVSDFIYWQRTKLGRDLNDSRLIEMIRGAGAKRVELVSPSFQVIEDNQIAVAENVSAVFAGLEKN